MLTSKMAHQDAELIVRSYVKCAKSLTSKILTEAPDECIGCKHFTAQVWFDAEPDIFRYAMRLGLRLNLQCTAWRCVMTDEPDDRLRRRESLVGVVELEELAFQNMREVSTQHVITAAIPQVAEVLKETAGLSQVA